MFLVSTHFCTNENITTAAAIDNFTSSPVTSAPVDPAEVLNAIRWPYLIVAIGHIVYSFGYIAVNYLPHKMPSKAPKTFIKII